jgi:hypothetical protein
MGDNLDPELCWECGDSGTVSREDPNLKYFMLEVAW